MVAGRPEDAARSPAVSAEVNLYWLPLGAGGHSVRLNGRAYEAVAALSNAARLETCTTPRSKSTSLTDGS